MPEYNTNVKINRTLPENCPPCEEEKTLTEAGWTMEGTCRNTGDWRKEPSEFRLSLFKNGVFVVDSEYTQGCGHRVDRHRKRVSYIRGRVTLHQQRLLNASVPSTPTLADVLYCLVSDADCVEERTFTEWCDENGYSDDSMKAMAAYRQCQDTLAALMPYLEWLRKALQDY